MDNCTQPGVRVQGLSLERARWKSGLCVVTLPSPRLPKLFSFPFSSLAPLFSNDHRWPPPKDHECRVDATNVGLGGIRLSAFSLRLLTRSFLTATKSETRYATYSTCLRLCNLLGVREVPVSLPSPLLAFLEHSGLVPTGGIEKAGTATGIHASCLTCSSFSAWRPS